jgi:hypothetical protein
MKTKHSTDTASPHKALVCGVGGQDGAWQAEFLLSNGYEVVGTSRDATMVNRDGLHRLGIADRVRIVSMPSNDYRSGLSASLSNLMEKAFAHFALDLRTYVQTIDRLLRCADIAQGAAEPLAAKVAGRKAQHDADLLNQNILSDENAKSHRH